jgi:hypothetical protein
VQRWISTLAGCCVIASGAGCAYRDSTAAGVGEPDPDIRPEPRNLQVMAHPSSARTVRDLMNKFDRELGVTCDFCHVAAEGQNQADYASDDNPRKESARRMMTMLDEINDHYLGQLGGAQYDEPVSCGHCHRGQRKPPVFVPAPERGP